MTRGSSGWDCTGFIRRDHIRLNMISGRSGAHRGTHQDRFESESMASSWRLWCKFRVNWGERILGPRTPHQLSPCCRWGRPNSWGHHYRPDRHPSAHHDIQHTSCCRKCACFRSQRPGIAPASKLALSRDGEWQQWAYSRLFFPSQRQSPAPQRNLVLLK